MKTVKALENRKVTLHPSIGLITTDDGNITRLTLSAALSVNHVDLSDLGSSRALAIVKNSLVHEVKAVNNVAFDSTRRVFIVTVSFDGTLRDLREAMKRNYGDKAADTWMEGNITLKEGVELHLCANPVKEYKKIHAI